jgi:hypothetical protein
MASYVAIGGEIIIPSGFAEALALPLVFVPLVGRSCINCKSSLTAGRRIVGVVGEEVGVVALLFSAAITGDLGTVVT